MLKKLRLKFVCINMLIVTMMLGVIFGLVLHFTGESLEEESLRMMRSVAGVPFQLGRPEEASQQVRLPYFTVQITPVGEYVTNGSGYFDLSNREFLEQVTQQVLSSEESTGILSGYGLRYLRQSTPSGVNLVFADMSSEKAAMSALVNTCVLIGAVSFLAFLGISILLSGWAVRPVEQAWKEQRQFVSDASHELKTPLTVILTNAELLQDPAYGEAAKRTFAANILAMSGQMRGLVESLLELARVDNGAVKTAFAQVELSQLVCDAELPFEPLYFERELELQSLVEPGIRVWGSDRHLRQVVEILLDNALKYAPAGSRVVLSLVRRGNHCLLTVSNPAGPMTQAELKNIFKRFYRLDAARSMDHSYGLGLPIARTILREHRGKIWAENSDGQIRFRVTLPLSHTAK